MNRWTAIAITWIAFFAVLAVNFLANYLPIGGMNTGQLSALYPNRFVPDGFTFSIWSVIYLWLLAFVGHATRVLAWLPPIDNRHKRITAILPLFWITCALNILWILAWHYRQLLLSLGIMILLLVTLIALFGRLLDHRARPRTRDHLLVEVPFVIYLGWISVATIANATALLVHLGWGGWGLSGETWSAVMMAVATAAGVWMAWRWNRPAYTLVIAWALWGIYRGQGPDSTLLAYTAMAGMAICIGVALRELLQPLRGWHPPA